MYNIQAHKTLVNPIAPRFEENVKNYHVVAAIATMWISFGLMVTVNGEDYDGQNRED